MAGRDQVRNHAQRCRSSGAPFNGPGFRHRLLRIFPGPTDDFLRLRWPSRPSKKNEEGMGVARLHVTACCCSAPRSKQMASALLASCEG